MRSTQDRKVCNIDAEWQQTLILQCLQSLYEGLWGNGYLTKVVQIVKLCHLSLVLALCHNFENLPNLSLLTFLMGAHLWGAVPSKPPECRTQEMGILDFSDTNNRSKWANPLYSKV